MIMADTRWRGQHGIGRYATEVLARLTVPFAPMPPGGSPSSPTDFIRKRLSADGLKPTSVYSPGYNGFLRNVPQLVTVHDLIHLHGRDSAKYRAYYDLFLKPLIKRNRRVITISETSKADIQEWLADDGVDVINAGEGASAAFVPEGDSFEAPRPYFLYVGNLRAHKNVDTLMAAMRSVEGADLYVVSSDRTSVRTMAAVHGIESRVKVFSGVDDAQLAQLYRGARATVQPSTLEGFGLPALESALCGTPVVFYEGCASVAEICNDEGIAVMSPTEPEQWAEALSAVTHGQRFPRSEGLQKYDWSAVARRIDLALALALAPRGRASD